MEKNGKKAVVIGMAKSGIASAKLLYELGYDVTVNDMKTDIKGLKEELSGIEYKDALGVDHAEAVKGADLVVLSPVVPIFSPFVDEARAAGAEVIGEIELGYRYCNRGTKFICISGTNGKTTTTALTGELFKAAGKFKLNGFSVLQGFYWFLFASDAGNSIAPQPAWIPVQRENRSSGQLAIFPLHTHFKATSCTQSANAACCPFWRQCWEQVQFIGMALQQAFCNRSQSAEVSVNLERRVRIQ